MPRHAMTMTRQLQQTVAQTLRTGLLRGGGCVRSWWLGGGLLACCVCVQAEEIRFNRDVRPILSKHCFACHGADEEAREAELRLDRREVAVASAAIVPGAADRSELITRIRAIDPDERMPPAEHSELSSAEKLVLEQWVNGGAEYETHWAFVPPQSVVTPASSNAIDFFVQQRLAEVGLEPAPPAAGEVLLRRVYLDLIGLPPTRAETQDYLRDDSENAYEKLVDRLLSSQHFGEHWARMWLDLARYADTKGYEKDNHRDIWRYRDWVIQAYNADLPYTHFTVQQLAGDLLPDSTADQILATAFHRNTMTNDEGGTDNEEFRTIAVKDRVDTTMQVWMGLTMGCAKCHSHKYDPITQREYYRFYAYFNQTEDADRGDEAPKLKTPTASQQLRLTELAEQLASTQQRFDALTECSVQYEHVAKLLEQHKNELAELEKQIPETPIMKELAADKRRKTQVHVRGNFLLPGEEVTAATPTAFGPFPDGAPMTRAGVAKWLLSEANPLTARVAVNRVWARIFGRGLVETEEDFGTQGTPPSHPQLLDWLAVEFRDTMGWSHKQLCKSLVMSATYRQSSVVTPPAKEKDPENRLLSRAPRYRLTAETVRDQALVAAGLLTRHVGGPSVMPPQPAGIWKATYSKLKWETAEGADRYRRGLYTYWRRTSPYPSMTTFDAGSREVCMVRRIRTNIPLQAFVTLNDPVFVEAAAGVARQAMPSGSTDRERLAVAFESVLVRSPTEAEMDRLQAVLNQSLEEFTENPDLAAKLVATSRMSTAGEPEAKLAAWTVVANVLLNLDEALMRN